MQTTLHVQSTVLDISFTTTNWHVNVLLEVRREETQPLYESHSYIFKQSY
jgi:hypothetical protein